MRGGGDYRHKVLDYLIKTTGIDPIKRFFPNKLRNKNLHIVWPPAHSRGAS